MNAVYGSAMQLSDQHICIDPPRSTLLLCLHSFAATLSVSIGVRQHHGFTTRISAPHGMRACPGSPDYAKCHHCSPVYHPTCLQRACGYKWTHQRRTSQGYPQSVRSQTMCWQTWSCTWWSGTTLVSQAMACWQVAEAMRDLKPGRKRSRLQQAGFWRQQLAEGQMRGELS